MIRKLLTMVLSLLCVALCWFTGRQVASPIAHYLYDPEVGGLDERVTASTIAGVASVIVFILLLFACRILLRPMWSRMLKRPMN